MEDNKQLDLGGFTLYDGRPVQTGQNDEETQNNIINRLVENVYFVFDNAVNVKKQEIATIEALPEEQQIHDFEKSKYEIQLPEPSTLMPRSKRLPEDRVLTKWQKFAKEKGIKKRKKTGLKYDPTLKKQVARWGARSKNNQLQLPIMEEKQDGKNPFQTASLNKNLKKQKEKLKQLKNKQFRENVRNGK